MNLPILDTTGAPLMLENIPALQDEVRSPPPSGAP